MAIARSVAGVRRVETYFLPGQPSRVSDVAISARLKAPVIGDGDLKASQLDWSVIAGHVALVGVVDRQAKIDAVVRHAQAIDGVPAQEPVRAGRSSCAGQAVLPQLVAEDPLADPEQLGGPRLDRSSPSEGT